MLHIAIFHARAPLWIFVHTSTTLPICELPLVISVLLVVSLHAQDIPSMIYLLCVAILHGFMPPPVIFSSYTAPPCTPYLILMTFSSHAASPRTVSPSPEPYMHQKETTYIV
jgi:hypothetical protein